VRELILGGVRSGKSRLAQERALASGQEVIYIATATAGDAEMAARIAAHRRGRPATWQVIEEPLQLAASLRHHAQAGRCLLVDCLTLWLTNLLCHEEESLLDTQVAALLTELPTLAGSIILVSNESGLGVVPSGALSRRYCDSAGLLHQQLAAQCERVSLVVAGLPLLLKGRLPGAAHVHA